jgi:hypothetical protein
MAHLLAQVLAQLRKGHLSAEFGEGLALLREDRLSEVSPEVLAAQWAQL